MENTIERPKPVGRVDLLALDIGTRVIRNPHFVDAKPPIRDLRHDLRFESESILLDFDRLDHLTPEDLITSLHVREVEIREDVGQQGEESVAHRMPEIENPVGPAREETTAENDIRLAGYEGLDQAQQIVWIVFEIRILNGHEFPRDLAKSRAQCRARARHIPTMWPSR